MSERVCECPACGQPVPDGAPACPACGADEATGWSTGPRPPELPVTPPRFGGIGAKVLALVAVVPALCALLMIRGRVVLVLTLIAVAAFAAWRLLEHGLVLDLPFTGDEDARLARLVALCHGDRAVAERLVAGEAARAPGASRRALIDRAIDRLRHDRRGS